MLPEFVARIGGSKWNRALPGGSRCVQAQPAGNAAQQSAEKSADSKNPAAPIYGGRVRVLSGGSRCVQAQPAGLPD